MIQADLIEQEIRQLFAKYKYPVIIPDMRSLQTWGINTAFRLHLPYDEFTTKVTEVLWAAINVQMSIGYTLIARETCTYPRGTKGTVFHPDDIPNMTKFPELHFWYHLHNARECIYRCWERMTNVLQSACYPGSTDKFYFNQLTEKLRKDPRFEENPLLRSLKKYEKSWSRVAEKRNKLSHGASSPFKEDYQAEITDLYNARDAFVVKYHYTAPDLNQELEAVRDAYSRVYPVWKVVMAFVDNIQEGESQDTQ